MKPLKIIADSYGPFADLDVDLPLGAVAVIGPNGAGKSTLVNAIDRALFGSRSMGDWLSTGAVEDAMTLCLTFAHDGHEYRVRRGFSAKGRGKPVLDFERWKEYPEHTGDDTGPEWTPLTRETIKETQAEIERVLGFDRAIFRASAFLVQGGAGSFTDPGLDPRQRKQLLCDLLGLDIYDRLLERVRYRATTIRDTTTRLGIQVEEAERELERKPEIQTSVMVYEEGVRDTGVELKRAEDEHRIATEKLNASREIAAKLTAAREVLASRERELHALATRKRNIEAQLEPARSLPKLKAESEALAGRRESIEAELAVAQEAEAARLEHRRLTTDRDRLVDAANELLGKEAALVEKFTALENAPGVCDRCEQVLEGDAWKQAIRSMKTEALGHHENAKLLEHEAETLLAAIELTAENAARGPNAAKQAELEAALRVAREAEKTLASITEREKVVEELAVEFASLEVRMPELSDRFEVAKGAVRKLEADAPTEDLEAAVARAAGVLHEARNDVEGAKSRLAVAQAELKRLEGIETRAKENRAALAAHQAELAVLVLAERAYGKAGLPALVLENRAIPLLEAKANEALSKLGGKTASARVELRTQREKKDGAGLIEALDIMVVSAEGFERRYESWSGGEQMRLDIAIRLGLLALSGAEMGILILDEPGNLDDSGKADLIELLQSVLTLGVERVLLVSHDSDLRDAFDSSIEVEIGEDGRSRLAGAVAEAVAA